MAEHVCPVWIGYLLFNPLRKLFQNPTKIFGPYISEGMKVLDIGCAMGFSVYHWLGWSDPGAK